MPDWKEEVRKRLPGLKLARPNEVEIVEELAQHLEQVYERAVRGGATDAEAKKIALLELAGDDFLREIQRSKKPVREAPVLETSGRSNLLTDFFSRLALCPSNAVEESSFHHHRCHCFSLGIGANTAIFSVVNTVLLRPLPYKDPERLVMVWEDASKHGYPRDTPAAANFVDWRDQNQVFEGMAAIADESFNFTGAGDPERLQGRRVSANLFPLLGVEPQIGRVFTAAEDQPNSERVVLFMVCGNADSEAIRASSASH